MNSKNYTCFMWFAFCVGCGDVSQDNSTAQRVPDNVQQIFTAHCAKSGCHAGSSPQNNQNLDSLHAYSNLVNVTVEEAPAFKRIVPFDTTNSYLLQKIKGTASVGDRMPFDQLAGGPNGYLLQSEIDTIQTWVLNGAPARQ